MNNDRNAIPKPMHVQVQELTAALEKALAQVKERDGLLDNARYELEAMKDNYTQARKDAKFFMNRGNKFREERDRTMKNVFFLEKKIEYIERKLGLDGMPGFDPNAVELDPEPFRRRRLEEGPPLPRAQYGGRQDQVNFAIQAGQDQMQELAQLREAQVQVARQLGIDNPDALFIDPPPAEVLLGEHRIVDDPAPLIEDVAYEANEQVMNRLLDNYRANLRRGGA